MSYVTTHVFVLLTHYFAEESLSVSLIMESTSRSRSSIDIGATVTKHSGIVPQLIAVQAVSGCDTVGCYHGIGNTKVVKALSAGIELNHLGDPKASFNDAMKESTHFIGACYGQKCDPSDTMSSIRYKVWVSHIWRKGASILPKLKSLPPTAEAFRENVGLSGLILKLAFVKLHCNRIPQSWIHLSSDGHPKDHQVHIAQCHYQVKFKLPLQIYLS